MNDKLYKLLTCKNIIPGFLTINTIAYIVYVSETGDYNGSLEKSILAKK